MILQQSDMRRETNEWKNENEAHNVQKMSSFQLFMIQ